MRKHMNYFHGLFFPKATVQYDKSDQTTWPKKLKVSGFGFRYSAWNGTYYRTSSISEGHPRYRLPAHRWLFIFWVDDVEILVYKDVWRLQPQHYLFGNRFVIQEAENANGGPKGKWKSVDPNVIANVWVR